MNRTSRACTFPVTVFTIVTVFNALTSAPFARADVKMPGIFGDHMVLQRDIGVPVWGWAKPGEAVSVMFGSAVAKAVTGADGKWRVTLAKSAGDAKPATLTITGKNMITFTDVLVGDVWLASGQSNMEYHLVNGPAAGYGGNGQGGASTAAEAITTADDPQLRLFYVHRATDVNPMADVVGKWEVCTADSVKPFSAVAYFFGRELRRTQHVPIGLIGSYWGGTSITVWISLDGLAKRAAMFPEFAQWKSQHDKAASTSPAVVAEYEAAERKYAEDSARWTKEVDQSPAYMKQKADWGAAANTARAANQAVSPRPAPPQPQPREPGDPRRVPTSAQYNGMIAPLVPYGIKGVIWYQGEGNTNLKISSHYLDLEKALIGDWRDQWGESDFPFLFVQLAAYGAGAAANELVQNASGWPGLRQAQQDALSIPDTGMATAVDIGNLYNVHPSDKVDVGVRLSRVARHVAYGEDIVCDGPTYNAMSVSSDKIRIRFDHAESGLEVASPPWNAIPKTKVSADRLQGFAIADASRHFVWADAKIEGSEVVVSSDQVRSPVAVRYAWANYPYVNLYNKNHLPALPFRTDDWKP